MLCKVAFVRRNKAAMVAETHNLEMLVSSKPCCFFLLFSGHGCHCYRVSSFLQLSVVWMGRVSL